MDTRGQAPIPAPTGAATMTRDCLDPWTYAEITAAGNIRPCCKFLPLAKLDEAEDVGSVRNNEKFRALREGLLSGKLDPICQECHFRKSVPTATLNRKVTAAARRAGETDLLRPLPITFFRIDINENCNLRCDYCAVSSPTYKGVEMSDAIFERAVGLLGEIDAKAGVHVNGHGETTFHPQWMKMCRAIVGRGFRPRIITNMAKNYTDEEVELLSQFAEIQISLDSDDNELMRKVRKAVRVEHVFETIGRIRAAAKRGNRKPPTINLSVGVYDPSIWTLERFADTMIRLGVTMVDLWPLVEFPHQKLVRSLDRLDAAQKERVREILASVSRKLDLAGVLHDFLGDFHALAPKPNYPRKAVGLAYAYTARYLAGVPDLLARPWRALRPAPAAIVEAAPPQNRK